MKPSSPAPGGRWIAWAYGLAAGMALFSGMAQMPIMKRYYIADLPGLAWSANFYVTSNLHYLSAALLLALLAWRWSLAWGRQPLTWSWGPRTWWGWLLIALLIISGAAKAARNAGAYLDPALLVVLDLTHLGSAMAFMFSGLIAQFPTRRRIAADSPAS